MITSNIVVSQKKPIYTVNSVLKNSCKIKFNNIIGYTILSKHRTHRYSRLTLLLKHMVYNRKVITIHIFIN